MSALCLMSVQCTSCMKTCLQTYIGRQLMQIFIAMVLEEAVQKARNMSQEKEAIQNTQNMSQ